MILQEIPLVWRLGVSFLFLIYPIYYLPTLLRISKCLQRVVSGILLILCLILCAWIISISNKPDLTLNCEFEVLPIPWKEGFISSIDVRGRFGSRLGESHRGSDKLPGFWPEEHMKNAEARRYTITNYGKSVIYDSFLDFKLIHREAIKSSSVTSEGKVVFTYISPMHTGKLAPNGGNFTFYLWNTSNDFINIEEPKIAVLRGGQKVGLKRTGKPGFPLNPYE